jgi:type I restriction enzyme R subunit
MAAADAFKEVVSSQLPALQLLIQLGWQYLTPAEALALRGGKRSNILLESVLDAQLRKLNAIRFKGQEYAFSEANIQAAVLALKDVVFDGLTRTNEKVYDLLLLGKSLAQTIGGDTKSFTLRYIDWNPATWLTNNVFHVAEEYEIDRPGSSTTGLSRSADEGTRRPDIVLFVNGIPLGVIECKRPDEQDALGQAISQMIRNQTSEGIPKLFVYTQLLLAVTKNEARYATTDTKKKFWAAWKEDVDAALAPLVNQPLSEDQKARLFGHRPHEVRQASDVLEASPREITAQDRALYSLCRPERLLELTKHFTLFDAGEKKIARYQQYFCVRKILDRVRQREADGRRKGGVVWHTQGSGKSLTMVMLAKALAVEPSLDDYKIVLVTDRVDLDDQIYGTFKNCAIEPVPAESGRHLAGLLTDDRSRVITTVLDKFYTAVERMSQPNDSPNVFVLVDEGHRGQYGLMHAMMRRALPNACFLGFTGTPVAKKEKDTIARFGGLIDTYTIRQAVADQAVVPLLYEGRDVQQHVDRATVDRWFDVITEPLTPEQRADLKRKFTTTGQLNKAEQKVREIALDISLHYRNNWQGTGAKAQLVAQDKATALLYKRYLDEFGMVSSEVLISGPDEREGYEETDESTLPAVVAFWKKMMARHGSEEHYNKNLINGFKQGDDPEIIIVVDKLLTGFDAPRNTVLYLTRPLKDHALLQAIARVNRLSEGKEFGYILDYRGVLENLGRALDLYGKLGSFDAHDLDGTLTDVAEEIRKLPQHHSNLWEIFNAVRNTRDAEQYERLLADEPLREEFYERLSLFARTLAIALASTRFMEETPPEKVKKYRDDLKFFMNLRTAVRKRYGEVVDFREYEARIQKLIDTHVGTGAVEVVTRLVNIFDEEAFAEEVDKLENPASKADTIAYRTKRTITERMDEDPAFYRKFSELLEEAIRAFREQRLADREYLRQVMEIAEHVRNRTGDEMPERLRHHEVAQAFYGRLQEILGQGEVNNGGFDVRSIGADAALRIDEIIRARRIVNWTTNQDVQNRMKTEIEDYLHQLNDERGVSLDFDAIDWILERCLEIARVRYPG